MNILDEIDLLANCWNGEDCKRAKQRLMWLYNETIEDDEEDDLKAESVECFRLFLESIGSEVIYPGITVSPDGNIIATWRQPPNPILGVKFIIDGNVEYTLVIIDNIKIESYGCESSQNLWGLLSEKIHWVRK